MEDKLLSFIKCHQLDVFYVIGRSIHYLIKLKCALIIFLSNFIILYILESIIYTLLRKFNCCKNNVNKSQSPFFKINNYCLFYRMEYAILLLELKRYSNKNFKGM